jgi:hypothetical protein
MSASAFWMDPGFLCKELFLGFGIFRIEDAAFIDWTNGRTLGVLMEAHTFGAQLGIDDIERIPFADRVIGAFRETGSTRNTVVRDFQRHAKTSS